MEVTVAISHIQGGEFELGQAELDAPREDEILVRVAAVGLCHTDIVGNDGLFGFELSAVLGHEGAGVVEAIGASVTKVAVGDRVMMTFRSCGICPKCSHGHPAYCHRFAEMNFTGMRPDGSRALHRQGRELISNFFGQSSFASHALTYERNVVKLPDDIPFEIAAPMGCGIQTGVGSVLNVLQPGPESSLLIAGGGAVGLSAVMAARISGCEMVIVVEPHAARRELARELGASHTIDPLAVPDLAAAIREIVPIGVDFAFDTTGRDDVLAPIMNALGPQGTIGLVGGAAPGTRMPGERNQVIGSGHSLRGIIEGDAEPDIFLPRLMAYYRQGKLPIGRLIRTYPFDRINEAVADQHSGSCVKVVFTLD